jgi:2-iminobutanoate/2-iminopropanoate deaminase
MREVVSTDRAPGAVGPYSQAIRTDSLVFASGQVALDPATGKLVEGGIEEQTRQVLANLSAVLEAAGTTLERVVRATVYLTDLGDFERVNAIYAEWFPAAPPARVCVEVSRLPKESRVEIDAIALLS